ncbi:MAG: SGNH/GDSL hydrolase family protein [Oscillospiraceae bacterium]|jgi:lysophospholipase L1-like esterase|nr:SGNH/GDSL hydrolase family protein [Oscillospiraceae bacterium]MCI1990270.1 SGNH/GDSL hydrolase family protein [Oscillospiraceae bacterium]MCI2035480.1 SGNH/GDSL hydrolase family protein [Oscillospiraceae bacterium]
MIHSVCVFGDSVSKGVVFDNVMKRYTLLKDSFANLVKTGADIAMRNYSKFGSTVTKGLETLTRHHGELKDYDYVALEFGGNDCDFNWADVAEKPCEEHQPHTPMGAFVQKYTRMIREIREGGSRPVLLSLPPIDAKRYFAWISRGLNAANILRWLGDVERIYRWHEMYNLAVCRLAKDSEAPLIDISSAFLEIPNYQRLICEDGIHPNEAGHRLISRTINDTIRQYRSAYAS